MYRTLLILLVIAAGFAACSKSASDPLVEYNAQKAIDDTLISKYLKANPGLNAKRIDTSGVYYIIKPGEEGVGNDLFTSSTQVTVGYTGQILTTGYLFAQTNNFHPSYRLSDVIRGWQLGIPMVKKNGKIRLIIPSRYAYGPYDQDSIRVPKNSVLDFNIQLYNVIN
ncbi:FKBP-type peptidyl-prolyl cis-trans isomerase [Mucilaginibacter sp. SP1R1]|uniref:FKBP-type peptidyl-prolyl cis-trans isomerase n=1 Tax=Mucilaginibacter sp. SP1R1 TaxID=2723091 RepID=UPI00160D7139|nr:FKBP-type peptidyl-prolyl cis-trans isomerase [Mucilaginibacter sp. SP1R1]MBB6147483.1 FKBP-type peptidyl-prolyl cis-trans isomerase FkpA [Mucilaginibacter sp. SP1R1]